LPFPDATEEWKRKIGFIPPAEQTNNICSEKQKARLNSAGLFVVMRA